MAGHNFTSALWLDKTSLQPYGWTKLHFSLMAVHHFSLVAKHHFSLFGCTSLQPFWLDSPELVGTVHKGCPIKFVTLEPPPPHSSVFQQNI